MTSFRAWLLAIAGTLFFLGLCLSFGSWFTNWRMAKDEEAGRQREIVRQKTAAPTATPPVWEPPEFELCSLLPEYGYKCEKVHDAIIDREFQSHNELVRQVDRLRTEKAIEICEAGKSAGTTSGGFDCSLVVSHLTGRKVR